MKKNHLLVSVFLIVIGLGLFFLSTRDVLAASNKIPFKTPAGTQTTCPGDGAISNGWCWICPIGPVGVTAVCKKTGTGADSYCTDTGYIPGSSCQWQLWKPSTPSPSPSPASNKITFSGKLTFYNACPTVQYRDLAGTTVVIYDNSNSTELGRTTAKMAGSDVTYSVTVNKVSSNQYKVKTIKDNYFDNPTVYSNQTEDVLFDIQMQPIKVIIAGKVIEEKTRTGISKVQVADDENKSGYTTSKKDGRYNLVVTNKLDKYSKYINYYAPDLVHVDRIYVILPSTCPINYADMTLVKKIVCEKITGHNVNFCWWGEKAVALKNNIEYKNTWPEISTIIENLRAKTQSNMPPTVNITGYPEWGAYALRFNKNLYINAGFITNNLWYTIAKYQMIPHEFAHTYNFTKTEIDKQFLPLLSEGNNLIKSKASYNPKFVYEILSAEWSYYGDEYGIPDFSYGYAGTNELELYAETFNAMWSFDSKMHQAITQNPATPAQYVLPQDIRDYSKKVHNAAAATFPHGNTISIQDFVDKLVAASYGN